MSNEVGLVLSGGGAKGAYHLGVLRAMREMDIPVDRVAGTSIGALNGAILASAPTLDVGVTRMEQVWQALAEQSPIIFSPKLSAKLGLSSKKSAVAYLTFLLSSGLRLSNPVGIATALSGVVGVSVESLLSDDVLQKMMQEYLDIDTLQKSLPLYVAVYSHQHKEGAFGDFVVGIKDAFSTEILGKNNKLAEFYHIQSFPVTTQKEMILASAALPLLFKSYQDETGRHYTDGGQGGMLNSQGNTPIAPLIEAGCKKIVVVHLDGSSLWHRYDFADDVQIIEIRPSIDMGGFREMLDFSPSQLERLTKTGYQDATRTLGRIKQTFGTLNTLRDSNKALDMVFDKSGINKLDEAMARLRGGK